MRFSDRWSPGTLASGRWIRQDFGTLSLLVMNQYDEWRVAGFPEGPPEGLAEMGNLQDLPEGIQWERWDHQESDCRLAFRPAFPTMPVVARPNSLLNLSAKGQSRFFVGIPACIEVMGEVQGVMQRLTGFSTQTLSKTWHGTPLSGRLAYALRTYARRVFQVEEWPEWDIVCSLGIVNDGKASMPFERLFLETDHLSVFEKDGRLWSNAARIRVAAEETNVSNVTYASRPASPYEDALELTPPKEGRARRSTIQSAFARVLNHFNLLEDPT